jgi:hypothetical protein
MPERNGCAIVRTLLCAALVSQIASGQASPPAAAHEVNFMKPILLRLADPDKSAGTLAAYETQLVQRWGLIPAELQTFRAATQQLRPIKQQIREGTRRRVLTGNSLASVVAQRDAAIASHSNSILASIRPVIAARFRAAAAIVEDVLRRRRGL